tara:strand:- start:2294 stop:4165 length:1872 start_codon:yes stop_codon:yes gene_type:complete
MDKTFIIDLAAQKVPQFKEVRSKDWIMYGVEAPYKNRYPEYLLDLFNASAKHHAIVKGKVDYIVGNGIAIHSDGLNTEMVARLTQLVKSPNGKEDLDALLYKMTLDLEIFGGFALEIIGNQTRQKIAAIYHADFCKYRKAKDKDGYYYSEEWHKTNPSVDYIPAFDPQEVGGKSLLYVRSYHPQSQAYPLPGYLGCVPYIEIDKELANYHLNAILNNFQGGKLLSFFNGQPTQEEQAEIERKLKRKYTGTDNANSIVLNFADSKEQGVEILNLDGNDFDKRYDILNDTVQQEVFSGHRITDPQLFGINQEGIFASRNQLRDAYELFQNTYVNGRQIFLEEVLNGLAQVQGFEGRLYIKPTEPLGVGFSEATRASVLTTDEIREELGYDPLETEQVVKETKLSKDDFDVEMRICGHFAKDGYDLDKWEVVGEGREVRFNSNEQLEASEDRIKRYGFTSEAFDFAVLEVLKKTPTATWEAVAAQLESTIDDVVEAIQKLTAANYMTIGADVVADSTQRSVKVTPQGDAALKTATPLEVTFKVAYRYVKSGEASGASVIKTTRDFCKTMVGQSKTRVWDSVQISNISMLEDRNVWLRRGGFWTRKGTDITTPYCRHVWEQVVIKEK